MDVSTAQGVARRRYRMELEPDSPPGSCMARAMPECSANERVLFVVGSMVPVIVRK